MKWGVCPDDMRGVLTEFENKRQNNNASGTASNSFSVAGEGEGGGEQKTLGMELRGGGRIQLLTTTPVFISDKYMEALQQIIISSPSMLSSSKERRIFSQSWQQL